MNSKTALRKYRLEVNKLIRLQKRKDFTVQGDFEFNRQMEIVQAAKEAVLMSVNRTLGT